MNTRHENLSLSPAGKGVVTKAYWRVLICAIALTLVGAILGSGVFHVHRSPQDEATCTICHIGHVPALAATVSNSLLPEPVAFEAVARPAPISHASADFSSASSRAPPAIA